MGRHNLSNELISGRKPGRRGLGGGGDMWEGSLLYQRCHQDRKDALSMSYHYLVLQAVCEKEILTEWMSQ